MFSEVNFMQLMRYAVHYVLYMKYFTIRNVNLIFSRKYSVPKAKQI